VPARPRYRRVVLKLSGEVFGEPGGGIDPERVRPICRQIAGGVRTGVQVAIVVGGGNFVRGRDLVARGIAPVTADLMGMVATVMNGAALLDILEQLRVPTRLQSAIPVTPVAEPYIRRRCISHLEASRVVILAGGTGSPHFTTDTAAALRAREIEADIVLKATNVDGVYSADPRKDGSARLLKRLTHDEVLHKDLKIMDATAVALCREGQVPILVFNATAKDAIRRALSGRHVGTIIGSLKT